MPSRRLEDMHPALREKWLKVTIAYDLVRPILGLPGLKLGQVWRSREEQVALYAQGRTAPGPIVTNAPPGQSLHERTDGHGRPCSRALDFFFDGPGLGPFAESHPWELVGLFGERAGLIAGMRWKRPDRPHLELQTTERQP